MAVRDPVEPPVHPDPLNGLAELEAALGHHFSRPDLAVEALTHPSAAARGQLNYERLEFLGDRVLGLIVATRLIEQYPREPVGDIAHRYNSLVRDETLVEIARSLNLGRHLKLSKGERETGGADRATILENAFEALIGAVYLDAGLQAAEAVILKLWDERLGIGAAPARDAKSRLGEWAQGRGHAPPRYVVVERIGPDHAPRFTIEVQLVGQPSVAASGGSRREAEQAAARAMLEGLGLGND